MRYQDAYFIGEREKSADPDLGFRQNLLHCSHSIKCIMEIASQSLSREIRNNTYSCIFCDSVWKRLQEGELHASLELLYLEHMNKYHGLTA